MIKLFTHTDLDGIGCEILARLAFKDIDVIRCNYNNINEKVENEIDNEEYKKIFITDISVNKEIADKLNVISDKVILLDHHVTALFLNEYSYALVQVDDDKIGKMSGTYLFYEYLNKNIKEFDSNNKLVKYLVELIRRYDTWEWKEIYNDINAKKLNDLMYMMGQDDFIEYVLEKALKEELLFDLKAITMLDMKQKEIDNYIKLKNKSLKEIELLGYKVGIVFADNYISELGNTLSELHTDLDFIAIINISSGVISYRTNKDNINLSDIAKFFGGGGHPKASGSTIDINKIQNFICDLFNKDK